MTIPDLTCIHIVLRLLVSCTRSLYQLSLVVVSLYICNQYVYASLYIKSDVTRYWTLSTLLDYIGAETWDDMAGLGIALPEPLHGEDAKSWFKHFEVCAAANKWNDTKKLLRTPTLLKGQAWAVFESLSEAETDTYEHLKVALLARLSPDTAEKRLIAREELSRKKLSLLKGGRALTGWRIVSKDWLTKPPQAFQPTFVLMNYSII